MPAETDKFVVATFALWAGDVAFAEELLRAVSSPGRAATYYEHAESPEDVIRTTGALRLRQLWQRKGEFRKLAAEYDRLIDQPLILAGKHIRGTVWRLGERNFQMQAYLTDLSWERELFPRAQSEAAKHQPRRRPETLGEQRGPSPTDSATRVVSWTILGNPLLQVELTDLALLEVSVVWVERELPQAAEQLREPLSQLIAHLDE